MDIAFGIYGFVVLWGKSEHCILVGQNGSPEFLVGSKLISLELNISLEKSKDAKTFPNQSQE